MQIFKTSYTRNHDYNQQKNDIIKLHQVTNGTFNLQTKIRKTICNTFRIYNDHGNDINAEFEVTQVNQKHKKQTSLSKNVTCRHELA